MSELDSQDGTVLVPVEISQPSTATRVEIARFLVELLARRTLVEQGLLPGNDGGKPR